MTVNPDLPLGYLEPDPEFRPTPPPYTGPRASFASFSESGFWPLADSVMTAALTGRGWELTWEGRVDTLYGPGPYARAWRTPNDRAVLWIRDYGRIPGGEHRHRQLTERTFWMLGQAGVHTALASVHSGAADWRPEGDRIEPGDIVVPWTFESKPWFNGLPGTKYESTWNNPDVIRDRTLPWPYYDDILAQRPARHFEVLAKRLVDAGEVRRLWMPEDVRAVLIDADHIGFETHYDILLRLVTSRLISESQPERPPVVTLHGAVVNPVLARLMSIDLLQYQVISNPAAGMLPSLAETHDSHVYDADEALRWLHLEAEFFETYPEHQH